MWRISQSWEKVRVEQDREKVEKNNKIAQEKQEEEMNEKEREEEEEELPEGSGKYIRSPPPSSERNLA